MIIHQRHEGSFMRQMEMSKHHFFLTGSRFFGGYTATSDWDYFVDVDSPGLVSFLESLGFQNDDIALDNQYDDMTIARIFRYNDVHVQLVKNASLKNKVQNILRDNVPMRNLPKPERKHMWNFAFRVALYNLGEPG